MTAFVLRNRGLLALLALAFASVMYALPAQAAPAAAPRTVSFTQEQVNNQYWVTNPRRPSVTNRSVDLQPGQLVINDTVTRRGGKTVQVAATLVPSVVDGRVQWSLSAATVDGQPVSAELQAQINSQISIAWARYVKNKLGTGRVTSVTITDNEITITSETNK